MSIKPFIRYYIGVQKRIGEKFTGFGLIFFNTLGRGGIGFSFGFKWSLRRTLPKNCQNQFMYMNKKKDRLFSRSFKKYPGCDSNA